MTNDDPMFQLVTPGNPGYFYCVEQRREMVRPVYRDGSGNLWTDRGHGGEPLLTTVDAVLGPVPRWQDREPDHSDAAHDRAENQQLHRRVGELEATNRGLEAALASRMEAP